MRYLIDTSAWIRHFASADGFDLRKFGEPEERILCLPVYQEMLQGVREESSFRAMKSILDSGRFVEDPLTRGVFVEAAGLYRLCRKQGITIRSSVDCLIAACAIRHNLPVLHWDRDYASIARVSTLAETGL